jgi:hypothetical protein
VSDSHKERFKKTVERLAAEVSILLTEQVALEELSGAVANQLVSVSQIALLGDRLARLIRILEDDSRREVAGFWYLTRCEPNRVALKSEDEKHLRDMATRLKPIRDKTFFHIDKNGVFDREAIYADAKITGNEIVRAIDVLWSILSRLYRDEFTDQAAAPVWLSNSRPRLKEVFGKDLSQLGLKRQP